MGVTSDKDLNKLVQEKLNEGWSIERGRKAIKIRHPDGGLVSMSISPSCTHAMNQVRRDIRRVEQRHATKKLAV